ncbi:MFS transporter [Staphylococcus sp. 11261D007BR]
MKNDYLKWGQLISAWITLFIIGTDLFVMSPLLPNIKQTFNVSESQASWLVTGFSVMYAVLAPVFGLLADKWGKKRNIVIGLICFTISNFLTFYASTFSLLIISRILAGGSASMITSSAFAITGDTAPQNRKGLWLSVATSGFLTAIWMGAPLGNLLSTFSGWRNVFLYLSLLTIILVILNALIYPKSQLSVNNAQLRLDVLPRIIRDVLVTMFWAFSVYGLYTYLGLAFQDVAHLSATATGIAFTFYGVGALAGSLSGGSLSDRLGYNRLIPLALIGVALFVVLVGATFQTQYLLFPLLTFWGICAYITFSSFQAFVSKCHAQQSGSVMAWNQTAMYVGITLGSVVGGVLMDNGHAFILSLVCAISAIIALVWFKFIESKAKA